MTSDFQRVFHLQQQNRAKNRFHVRIRTKHPSHPRTPLFTQMTSQREYTSASGLTLLLPQGRWSWQIVHRRTVCFHFMTRSGALNSLLLSHPDLEKFERTWTGTPSTPNRNLKLYILNYSLRNSERVEAPFHMITCSALPRGPRVQWREIKIIYVRNKALCFVLLQVNNRHVA